MDKSSTELDSKRLPYDYKNRKIHRLSDVDVKNKTAFCSYCNKVVSLNLRGKNRNGSAQVSCTHRARLTRKAEKSRVPIIIQKLMEEQENKCAICGREGRDKTSRKRGLCVDHCHTSLEVRGLLCSNCNAGIGFFEDNIYYLLNAVAYLRKPSTGIKVKTTMTNLKKKKERSHHATLL